MIVKKRKINRRIDHIEKEADNFYYKEREKLSKLVNKILSNSERISKRYFADIENILKRLVLVNIHEPRYDKISESSFPFAKEVLLYAIGNEQNYNRNDFAFMSFVMAAARGTNFENDLISFVDGEKFDPHFFSYRDKFILALNSSKESFDIPGDLQETIIKTIGSRFPQTSKKAITMALFFGIGEDSLLSIKNVFIKEVNRMLEMNEKINEHRGMIGVINDSVQDLALAIYLISGDEKYNIPFVDEVFFYETEKETLTNFNRILEIVTKLC